MDSLSVDVTAVAGVTLNDEFVLLGGQGNDRITANELARRRASLPQEVLATVGPRLPPFYLGEPRPFVWTTTADEILPHTRKRDSDARH